MSDNPGKAGEAFLINPPGGYPGPGVLVLHSWWGLNDWTRGFCGRLAGEGFTVVAPDLLNGARPESADVAERLLGEASPDEMSGLVISSAHALRRATLKPDAPIAVVGFSMGGSLAFWLAARLPVHVKAAVSFYGTQSIDFDEADASFQGHFGTDDHMVSEEDRVVTESFIRLGGRDTDFHVYDSTGHWFMEDGQETFDPEAADLAFARTVEFLNARLRAPAE